MSAAPLPQVLAGRVAGVARALAKARRVCFITGAGISADSGLPTYRGLGGLYNDVVTAEGLPIEELLSGRMFRQAPATTWKYIAQIEAACRGARCNDAHRAIARLERTHEVVVVTQNVDGFHRDAGSTNVIELHGDLHRLACTRCRWCDRVPDYEDLDLPPRCPVCRGIMRPEVVLFGEMLPDEAVARRNAELERGFDMIFAVGTTAGFPYISGPVEAAARLGVPTVEVNPDVTPLSAVVDWHLPMGAVRAFGALKAVVPDCWSAADCSPVLK